MDNENNSYTNMLPSTNTFDATKENGTTATSNTHKEGAKESLASVMKDLEEEVNPKSVEESIKNVGHSDCH